ncbi:MAG: HAMP domain-containing protein [Burkholderiaceae bacterium]|nr:HAMP domain-containing protein [Burkholderiaceae bacterium]
MRRLLPSLTLFWRFFFGLLVAALLPLLVTWYVARSEASDKARQLAVDRLRIEAVRVAQRADAWLNLNYETLAEHADTIAIRSMLTELQKPVLVAIANHQPWTQLAFTVGPDGMSLTRSDNLAPIDYHERTYFKIAMAGQVMGQQMLISKTTNRPSWVVSVPVKDEQGKVLGVLAKTNGLNELTDLLANASKAEIGGESGRAILIAPDGKLAGLTGATFDKDLRDWTEHPLFQNRERTRGGVLEYDDCGPNAKAPFTCPNGTPVIAAVEPAKFGWLVAVQMDKAEALKSVAETDRTMSILLFVAVLLAAAFAAIFAPGLSRPLVRLTTIAEDMSRGHFDHEIPGTERRDEIGGLSRAIERMTRSLRLAMDRLTKSETV